MPPPDWVMSDSAPAQPAPQPAPGTQPTRRARAKWLPDIDTTRCTGCGWCVAACPEHVLTLARSGWRKTAVLTDADACTGCTKCAVKCPLRVIAMVSGHT